MGVKNLTEVSIPIEETNEDIMVQLKSKIEKGDYTLGDLIVPQMFENISLKDGTLIKEEVVVRGRKIPFRTIRENINKTQKNFMRLMSDNEISSLSEEEIKNNLKKLEKIMFLVLQL